ncbi:MAG: InlB B-repeat-containing protein [Anaeroplasmataceae bacterium]|nr:InlB B-repeat-containing protein [Anaeroplasmataceae bacterium]MDE6415247.1 InlB B-repeat-containing protein [Anaeroplasmataceae bacterium]
MAKFKKLFLSAAMLFGICAIGGGLTSHAEEGDQEEPAELTEHFSFDEEFNYTNEGTVTTGAGSNASLQNISTAAYTNELVHDEDQNEDYLKISFHAESLTSCAGTNYVFRPNGGAGNVIDLASSSNKDAVIKIRFKTGTENRKTFRLYMAGGNYDVINLISGHLYYTFNNKIDGSDPDYETFGSVSVNQWHEAVIVLKDNGAPADASSPSPDRIYLYLDNQFIYEKPFKDGKNYNGQVSQLIHLLHASTKTDEETCIDYIRVGQFNAPVVTQLSDMEAYKNIPFAFEDFISGANSAYLPSILPTYDVDFTVKDSGDALEKTTSGNITTYSLDGTDYMEYSTLTKKYTALTETELTATITCSNGTSEPIGFEPISFDISVSEYTEPIPVEEIVVSQPNIVKNDSITLGAGEKYDLTQLFGAYPTTATDLEVSYTVEDEEIAHVTDSTLEALANGSTTLTITANGGGEEVSKEITLNVTKGYYSILNGYTTEDTCTAGGQEFAGYESSKASTKDFAPVTVVTDPVFGNVIKFTGVGETTNGAAAHLNLHIPAEELVANKDYKLTGWVKMENDGAVNKDARLDVKIIMYYLEEGNYGYPKQGVLPYRVEYATIKVSQAGSGWVPFEMEIPANFDTNANGFNFAGLKVEIAAWNVQDKIDSYITHLNLVEQDSVNLSSWELADEEGPVKEEYTLSAGSTLQLNAVPVPSTAVVEANYESSDPTIATVDENGLVTTLNKAGETTITVTVGTVEKTVKIIVTKGATAISGDKNSFEMNIDEFEKDGQYEAVCAITVTPADSTSVLDVTVADETVCKAELIDNELWLSDAKVGSTTVTVFSKDDPTVKFELTVTFTKGGTENPDPETYAITFDMHGHGTAPTSVAPAIALPTPLPSVADVDGWHFEGWYLDAEYKTAAEAGASITSATVLHAKWSAVSENPNPETYTITYDVQGHGIAPTIVANVTALPAKLPEVTAEGYVFGGWYLDADCTTKAVEGAAITANTTLYAKWTQVPEVTYTITYDVQGHGTAPASVTGTKLPDPLPVLSETGYTFGGWYLDANCTQAAEAGAEITEDTTLYAKWTEKQTVTPTPEKPKKNGLSGGAVAGIVIGVIAVLGLAGGLAFFFIKKNQAPKAAESKEEPENKENTEDKE